MKNDCELTILMVIAGLLFVCLIIASYSQIHQGGWYCEYCHQGSTRSKYDVEQKYGNQPCTYSVDSCHHFIHYFSKPGEKPKYIK